ncbi:Transcriptional regulator, LysR family [Vibrio coralliirubri]|uniref:LysR family transcriptional regulator n=1 Tax=Vibrio coralliirubri TaxID=1516159 RepID=UPI000633CE24|nr:LysR family transcriptional regulator [Vibrio coralliirubri]CDT81114.1 Transcriptional regulator, LysR family [Vibrio coralliirubri]CDT86066.1 Transcriptional regulator, LysR family [Vibrio coralliirubri]
MKYEDIAKIDLNLLKLLKVLGEERNTRRAAERMFVGQPTVSKALKKIRELFDDEMFIREAHGLKPTPLCELVLTRLPTVFEAIEGMFEPYLEFDPNTYIGEISVAINPVFYQPIIKKLYPKLRKLAPSAEYRFVNWTWDTEAKLQQGQIQVGINFSPINLSINIRNEPVCPAQFGFVCAKDSPFAKEGVTFQSLETHPLILMVMPNFADNANFIEIALRSKQIKPKVFLRSDQLNICLEMLLQEPVGMPVSSLVSSVLPEELIMLPLPDDIPRPQGDVSLYFSHIYRQSPKTVWLKKILSETILEIS